MCLATSTVYGSIEGSFTIADFEPIDLVLSQDTLSEADEPITLTLTRLSDSQGLPITISLATDRPDKLQVPTSVVIPAGLNRVNVQLRSIDNRLLDGLVQAQVTAQYGQPGEEYVAGVTRIDIADHEALSITLTPSSISENGGRSRGRLTRSNTDLQSALSVGIVVSHPELVSVPASVTIPAGAEYIEFDVDALDNDLLSPDTVVRLEAVHAAYLPESETLTVMDYEPLAISLNVLAGQEGSTLVGTITRNISNLDQPATVNLTSSDESEVTVPAGIVIPAGQRSATFVINLLPDRLSDGVQTANLTARAAGYIGASVAVTINDHEFLSVKLVDDGPLSESAGVALARLTRSDVSSDFPLLIKASSTNPAVAYLQTTTLQMEAHQSSIEFPIYIVDDSLVDGTQSVQLKFEVQDAPVEGSVLDLMIDDDDTILWSNVNNPLDVNASGVVTPLDALLVINYLNIYGARPVAQLPAPNPSEPTLVDTSRDQNLSAIDALLVINYINGIGAGEGESMECCSAATAFDVLTSIAELGANDFSSRRRSRLK